MTSLPTRDQAEDHLLTPKNCALIVIDYRPIQVGSIASMDRRDLVMNIVAVARTAKTAEELPPPQDLYTQLADLLGVGSEAE